jgi:hypothetical protein
MNRLGQADLLQSRDLPRQRVRFRVLDMKGQNRLGYPYWCIRIDKRGYTIYKEPATYRRACAFVVMATPAMMIAAPAQVASW